MEKTKFDKMIEKTALDYAEYLKVDASKELLPVHRAVDEMLTRLEEFETLMKVVQEADDNYSTNAFLKILGCKEEIDTLRTRIDHMQVFVDRVGADLAALDRQIDAAEARLGVPDSKLKTFLKPFLNKITKETAIDPSDVAQGPFTYVPPKTFKTDDYFQNQ